MEIKFCIFCAAIGEAVRPLALSKSPRDDSAEEDSPVGWVLWSC